MSTEYAGMEFQMCYWLVDTTAELSLKTRDRLEQGAYFGCLLTQVQLLLDQPPVGEGLYIICEQRPSGSFQALALGTTRELSEREWISHPAWQDLLRAGASHVHYVIEPSEQVRLELADGIRSQFQRSGHCLSAELS